MNPEEMLKALSEPFPKEAIKQRTGGGGKSLSYVSTDTVIRRLNRVCKDWSWAIDSHEFVGDLFIVTGTLTIPGLGSRCGIGVQKVSERGGEDLVKGGSSDALKKAGTLFGIAIELYGDDVEAIITEREAKQQARAARPPRTPAEEAAVTFFKAATKAGLIPQGVKGDEALTATRELAQRVWTKFPLNDTFYGDDVKYWEHVLYHIERNPNLFRTGERA